MLSFGSLLSRRVILTCRRVVIKSRELQTLRPLSTIDVPLAQDITDTRKRFNEAFSHLSKTLCHEEDDGLVPLMSHFQKVLEYNVPHGKQNRGISSVTAYQLLVDKQLAKEEIYLAHLLGWCIELMQAYFLILDDIMDESTTRRNQPCWYKKDDVGLMAINDAVMIEGGIYKILRKCFRDHKNYVHILELFHEVFSKTSYGQGLDMLTADRHRPVDLSKFTETTYSTIVEYKTAYYTCFLPVALALYLSGITNANVHAQAKLILLKMGNLFQVQDDYMGCFADAKEMGKVDNDIEEGKCTWLIVKAAKIANAEQRKILQENYGYHDEARTLKVRKLYQELQLPSLYAAYQKDAQNHIEVLIKNQTHECLVPIFNFISTFFLRKT